jgi:hypothetical protein
MQHKFCVAIDTQIATKSPFRCNSITPIATELVVLPKGFVAIGGNIVVLHIGPFLLHMSSFQLVVEWYCVP